MKRSFAFFLAVLTVFTMSCGTQSNAEKVTDTDSDTAVDTEVVTQEVTDDLGDYDFGEDTFDIRTRSQVVFTYPLNVEEATGDVFDDAVYNRNRKLEERFHFTFSETYYSNNNEPRTFLLAGDNTYNMYVGRCTSMYTFAAEGLAVKAEDIPHLNFDKPYWDSKLYDNLAVYGKHYFAVGAFNTTSYDFTHVLLFNKKMMEDYQLGNIYSIVREGKWTFDTFAEMGRKVVEDLNGDATLGDGDQYGYTSLAKQVLPGFWISANTLTISKNKNDELVYSSPKDEKFIEVYQKIFNITWDDNIWHRVPRAINREEEIGLFCDGYALFTDSSCFQISNTRESLTDFGIIPYPKYDEAQDTYYSRIEGCELFLLPKFSTNAQLEMAGVILEAMACESMKTVVPAYYDVALKVKYTRDEESAEMLDIAFANRVFDFGDTVICEELRDGVLLDAMAENNRNVASLLATAESAVSAKIATFNEAFSEQ